MKVSFTGAPEHMYVALGYGNASWHIFQSMKKLGLDPVVRDKEAKVGISFCQPAHYSFGENQYKIGYTPWESTEFLPNWQEGLELADEIWTTSHWNKKIFEAKLDKEVFVYLHGIDKEFMPMKRKWDRSEPFTFLHIGEPFNRKDGQLVVDVFARLYGNDPRYRLIMKCTKSNMLSLMNMPPNLVCNNIIIRNDVISREELIDLYASVQCFVYPSWGEGFGFNPLQALAMGIPTICTAEWAEYKDRITLPLDSESAWSPWQEVHPGYMVKPSAEQLAQHMVEVVENYDKYCAVAFKNSVKVHREYDWDLVTRPAAGRLKKIIKN